MKLAFKLINICFAILLLFVLAASIGSAITKEPQLLSVIRSNSMYPVFERGDMVLIQRVTENNPVELGDIVIFTTEEGNLSTKGWIMHRVMAGDASKGFITQGDANSYTDQDGEGTGPIHSEWIVSKAITVGNKPIVIPWIGHLPLKMEEYQSNPFMLPALAVTLALTLGLTEIFNQKKKRKRKSLNGLELPLIYMLGGLTIAIGIGATMITTSQHINIPYAVSENSKGVMMGSNVGQLRVGDEMERTVSNLSNHGFFPLIATITTNDPQIKLSHHIVTLHAGDEIEAAMKLSAQQSGSYHSSIRVGLFYPFLPKGIIYFLAEKSYWLALITVSFIPALPIMIYPFLDKKVRRKARKEVRRKLNNLKSTSSLG